MKWEKVAASISGNKDVVDMLDRLLTETDDRAYIICSASECRNNLKGRCTIHTVKARRKILSNGRCSEYLIQ